MPEQMSGQQPAAAGLVLFGAAAGVGRWLARHVLSRHPWRDVVLVDVAGTSEDLDAVRGMFVGPADLFTVDGPRAGLTPERVAAALPGLVLLAVPPDQLHAVCRWLPPGVTEHSSVVVVADLMAPTLAAVRERLGELNVLGLHALFEPSMTSAYGQIAYVVPARRSRTAHQPLTDLLRAAGVVVKVGTEDEHDASMAYVQEAAHRALVRFAEEVAGSGLDLQEDLWAARTPLFETLFSLAVRVLEPHRQPALERIAPAEGYAARLPAVRDAVPGTLFDTASNVAAIAVSAAQSTRGQLAAHLASGEVVGVANLRRPGVLHVGRIVEVGTTVVTVEDLLVTGPRGGVLLAGPGRVNQRRTGAGGGPRRIQLSLGHAGVVTGAELSAELDRRMAFIRRDVRFLVPESVSGAGVLRTVRDVPGTRGHRLASEVVRTGQRSVVVRLEIRADLDLDGTVEALRALVQEVYRWPQGLCRPMAADRVSIAYLGPPGTFSEAAARQCATSAGRPNAALDPMTSFEEVLATLGPATIGVIPISSSSSGLVSRAVRALSAAERPLTVGGVVDVSVRLDCYIPAGRTLEQLRGAQLFSHPQAISQCSAFIARWRLTPVPCASTTEALAVVAAAAAEPAVALASADADVAHLGLKVGEREVDDLSGSITRFLIVGDPDAFLPFSADVVPTLRNLYVARPGSGERADLPVRAPGPGAFDEVLSDAEGGCLWITSRPAEAIGELAGLRLLGTAPWSPRTPVVRAGAAAVVR